MHPGLLLNFFRPISALFHELDYRLYPNSPWLMHLQSLLWFAGGIWVVSRLFQSVLGRSRVTVVAAFMFAVDHTHGFPVGWLANRNALIAFFFGALALLFHDRATRHREGIGFVAGPLLLLLSLLSGEIGMGAWAYLLAHAIFLDESPVRKRLVALLPYVAVTVLWRIGYSALGYGAYGSGIYVDPVHEPLHFAAAVVTRLPVLFLGLFSIPPAEASYFFGPHGARWLVYGGLLAVVAFVITARPLFRFDRPSRYFSAAFALSLLPACTVFPHNRLLFFASIGAMGVLSRLTVDATCNASWLPRAWHWQAIARTFVVAAGGLHLFFSPFLLPLAACNVVVTDDITKTAIPSALDVLGKAGGRDLIVVSAPDYYYVALIRIQQRLSGAATPEHLRLLSIGSVDMTATRLDAHRLKIDYEGGLLASTRTRLYRGSRFPMASGDHVDLEGLRIDVTRVTPDGRPESAVFTFTDRMDASRFTWVEWSGTRYVPFELPSADGQSVHVVGAPTPFQLTS
jgi:hypothetical protein